MEQEIHEIYSIKALEKILQKSPGLGYNLDWDIDKSELYIRLKLKS